MKQLFVSDLDGTLLDSESRISPATASAISTLSRDGALITIATARTPATVDKLMSETHIKIPAIVLTGASLWHFDRQAYSDTKYMELSDAQRVLSEIRSAGLSPFIYTIAEDDNVLHVYHNGPMSATDEKFVAERRGLPLKRFHIDEPDGLASVLPSTVLYLVMGPADHVAGVAASLTDWGGCSVSLYPDIFHKDLAIMEILAKGVSKAAALKSLAASLAVDRITVFGDNLNDLPMMDVADVAVAVSNALDEVKRRADVVIGSNNCDSVARYLIEKAF